MLKRIGVGLVNIFFPPLAVMLLAGPEMDMVINCILFLCAIIPSHIHGFYLSMTYFGRKRKVRKGQYPGDWRRGIYSERIQYGGATRHQYQKLKAQEKGGGGGYIERQPSRRERTSQRIQEWDDGHSEKVGNTGTSIYARNPSMRRRPSNDRRTSSYRSTHNSNQGVHDTVTDAANIRPSISSRQPSRRSIYNRAPTALDAQTQGQAPISRSSSRRTPTAAAPVSPVSSASQVSPATSLQRSTSERRRVF